MTGSADDGREDGTGCVISGETSLAHTGAVVDNQSCYIIVTHFAGLGFEPGHKKKKNRNGQNKPMNFITIYIMRHRVTRISVKKKKEKKKTYKLIKR